MASLLLGIDGGQTSTTAALVTETGELVGVGKGGNLVHLNAAGGEARFVQSVGEAVAAARAAASSSVGAAPGPLAAAALGLTGVEAGTREDETVRRLLPEVCRAEHVLVENDAAIALQGAHLGGPGVIVIAGTGSICMGLDAGGRTAVAGGWGWLVGDEGSANVIGRLAVTAAFHSFDGTGPATALESALAAHFELDSLRDLKRLVYAADFGARGFAALAPLVQATAAQGDAVSARLLDEAGAALAKLAATVAARLEFDGAPAVAPVGGTFEHLPAVRGAFVEALAGLLPGACVAPPALPPVLGAAILALKAAGCWSGDTLARLRESAHLYLPGSS